MTGIAAFGPRAASFGARFRTLMIDERRPLSDRGRAARALQALGAPLDAQEAALARVLAARLLREEREAKRPGVRKAQHTEMDAARLALETLNACREDAGLGRASVRLMIADDQPAGTYEGAVISAHGRTRLGLLRVVVRDPPAEPAS